MTKTLVINPPFLEPHRPPISCAIVAEIAQLAGHDATVVDINIDLFRATGHTKFLELQTDYLFGDKSVSDKFLENFIQQSLIESNVQSYDWILISCFSDWELETTKQIARYCRQNSGAKIVVGGPGVHADGHKMLADGYINYYVLGEGEIALKELFNGNDTYAGINGSDPVQIDDIENLPLPNYSFFDFKKYDWLLEDPDVFIYGSRGCVRKCTFCDIASYWPKFRYRTGKSIADEMIMNYEKYGVKNFYFADSLLNGNLKEFRYFLDRLSRFDDASKFHWGGFAIIRPKGQHPAELFDQIQAAGGQFLSVGVETGVDRIRYEMKKSFTNDDIDWHLEQSQRIGLQNLFLLITNWYSETLDEHHEYLKIFKRWQNYAVDGTIFGMVASSTLSVMDNTPISRSQELIMPTQEFSSRAVNFPVRQMFWMNKKNPELDMHERYRRSLAVFEEAIKYNWNITNKQTKLRELKSAIEIYQSEYHR
jgi:hypothetical protein